MIIHKMSDLSYGISPLRDLTNKYKDSKKPNTSEFSMNEKKFICKIKDLVNEKRYQANVHGL